MSPGPRDAATKQRVEKAKKKAEQKQERTDYVSASEYMSINEKKKLLEQLGKPELVDLFRDWKPQIAKRKRRTEQPLDQRVAVSVTTKEKESIEAEIARVRKSGDNSNVSQFIRGRVTASVDVQGWRDKAEKLLFSIDEATKNEKKLKRKRTELYKQLENIDENDGDNEDKYMHEKRIREINDTLESLTVEGKRRTARLSGRMTTPESEIIKWRANRLSLSVSDYLRLCLYGHEPGGEGDAHLSVDAKKRFYISIIDVAENGWGEAPTINQCKNCISSRNEAEKYKQRVRALESFLPDVDI